MKLPRVLLVVAVLACAAPAFATDYYVDVVNGNNANSGLNPGSAWRTLTFASGASGSGSTLHIAPGTYSAASGETFPLYFSAHTLIGTAGSAATRIDGGGTGTLLRMFSAFEIAATYTTLLRGLTFTNADSGIVIDWQWWSLATHLEDVAITNMTGTGFRVNGGGGFQPNANVHVTLDRVRCTRCTTAVHVTAIYSIGRLIVQDSIFEASATDGVRMSAGWASRTEAVFDRCRFTGNGGSGVLAFPVNDGDTDTQFSDCLIAQNGDGCSFLAAGTPGTCQAALTRCTVADNAGFGIRSLGGSSYPSTLALQGNLVHGNATDVLATNPTTDVFNLVGGVDPQFVDRANADYRLRFVSPAVDVGDPATDVGTLDLARVARSIDGNLDTQERADIGCFEFQPLGLESTGQPSTPLRLLFWGETGSSAVVYFSRGGPFGPTSTPFGEFDLNPASFGTFIANIGAAPDAPVIFQRQIPHNPGLIGQSFSFQAATTSSVAPQGAAYTNAVRLTLVP